MNDNEGRRNPRLRLACARCQRRKIRCDGQYPTCSNCRKASTDCVDGDSIRLRNGPQDRNADRAVINRLRRRIAGLESIIRERLPDIDLTSNTFPDLYELAFEEGRSTTEPSPSPIWRPGPETTVADRFDIRSATAPDHRAHQIGLISVGFNAEQKYIGPSSGYFLARLLLANSRRDIEQDNYSRRHDSTPQTGINDLVSAIQGPLPLPPQALATQLFQVYFDTVQPQFPILHEPSFRTALIRMYDTERSAGGSHQDFAATQFQIFMVLAIAASIWTWRTKRQIPAESYCLSALQHLDRIAIGSSLPGLQCMILLLIFTMHCPHMQLNVWNLNYQCIAAVLDLGLQRQVTTSLGISLIEQEMRTRTFWSVFTIDRTIATMMGRPIGLRDEACDLRLPQLLSDDDLTGASNAPRTLDCNLASSVHMFKLAKLNSEIKYVANSIVRDVPSYAYPPIQDLVGWQQSMLQRLDGWAEDIPQHQNEYMKIVSELRYHSIKMLLLRPSPAITNPSTDALRHCYMSARHSIQLYTRLYNQDLMVHDWMTLHGVVLSLITILYCTRAVPGSAQMSDPEELMSIMSVGLSILSASGEHWSGAKRAREILDDLGKSTISWLRRSHQQDLRKDETENEETAASTSNVNIENSTQDGQNVMREEYGLGLPDLAPGIQLDINLFPELHQRQDPFGDAANLDDIMRNLFDDFIPRPDSLY
ncbi:C6 transcription factor (fungal specific transcription factor) [Stagonosporopsis vannaccii]|nr:C6 transcription factor (fungal specific transcription factor) [Stagonosporopsis vannaccii]